MDTEGVTSANLGRFNLTLARLISLLTLIQWNLTQISGGALEFTDCKNCVRLSSFGKPHSLKRLELWYMDNLKYLDDECQDGTDVRVFPSLEDLVLKWLPNLEGLLKVERGEMFPCLSHLEIASCPKLRRVPCLQSLKRLTIRGFNNELLGSISILCGLTTLNLFDGYKCELTSFPEGMLRNLTCLQNLRIFSYPKLKELPNEPFNLAMEHFHIPHCDELESLPEQSLRTLEIWDCKGLLCLPEGIRHLTSLEYLLILSSPTLVKRCKEGTGEDWDKIAHIPRLSIG
ncbi:hypothetical protein TSUD_245850 [Trifolium subterraneum]|uniref:NB-ARC domain-containing protein n=1 Tax=Trifolium subterraneum TaxID=3900 RepID=A0A2Z6NTX6_TRISU|nr:hypothetical protein TSUD_245850 [Trifolium subterraneum]